MYLRKPSNWWPYEKIDHDGSIVTVTRDLNTIAWSAKGTDGSECPISWEPVFVNTDGSIVAFDSSNSLF